MAYQLDHKYFISLALQDKIAWDTLPFIIEGLTSTLEKSKEVNKFLLQELEKYHKKVQSLEKELSETKNEHLDSKIELNTAILEDELLLSDFESEENEVKSANMKNVPAVHDFNHEMFAFESELKIKTEFKKEPKTEPLEKPENKLPKIKIIPENELKSIKCNTCGKSFPNLLSVQEHGKIHHGKKSFQCKICHKKFRKCQSYKQHLETHSKSEELLKCKTCSKKFQHLKTLKDHEIVHLREETFKCNFCEKCFKNGSELFEHKKQVHFSVTDLVTLNYEVSEERMQNFCNVEYL